MYTTNNNATAEVKKRILNDIDPTGIWKNLELKSFTFDDAKNYIYFELYHPESDSYRREAFFAPKEGASEGKVAYDLNCIEHFIKAFVPPVKDPETGADIRFGKESLNVDTFKDFCEFYTSKIDLEKVKPVDLKGLWGASTIVADPNKPYARPRIDKGNMPFISSEYAPEKLSVQKEISDAKYPKFLSYTVEGMVEVTNQTAATNVNANSEDLPF
jgi:hypothetical protein